MLVAAGVLWGTGGLLGRLLAELSGLSPLAVAAVRLGLGGVLLVSYVAVTGGSRPCGRAAWRRICATGLLAASFQVSYFTAVTLTGGQLRHVGHHRLRSGAGACWCVGAARATASCAGSCSRCSVWGCWSGRPASMRVQAECS